MMYQSSKVAASKPDFDTDNQAEAAFVDFFRRMPTRTPGTIRMFERNGYYSTHGEDALYIADNVYYTKTVLKYWRGRASKTGQAELPACTLSTAVAINFLREALTTKQLRIEIWAPASSSKSNSSWELSRAASPGNLADVEDLLFGAEGGAYAGGSGSSALRGITEAPICLSTVVKIKNEGGTGGGPSKTVGIAYLDSVDRKIGLSEFAENDIYSNTESLLIQLGIKEVVLPELDKTTQTEGLKLRKLIERCGIVFTERKRTDFSGKNIEQDLNNLIKGDVELTARPQYDLKLALSACSALVSYLDLLSTDNSRGYYTLTTHDLSHYMRLDASAVRALTLMPDSSTTAFGAPLAMSNPSYGAPGVIGKKDPASSLYALLNKCKTAQGQRLLAMWLKQPLVNLHQIEHRQELVQAFVDNVTSRSTLREDLLKLMPDFSRLSKRFQTGKANLDDVVRAYQAVQALPMIVEVLEKLGGEDREESLAALLEETYLAKLHEDVANLSKLVELVETTIDTDALGRHGHNVVIRADFDDMLRDISDKLIETREGLNQLYRDAADDLGLETDDAGTKGKGKKAKLNFENHQVFGHCFRLTRKEAGILKGKSKYIELANRQNGCHFTTKKLKNLNQEFTDLQEKYERKQSGLAKEVVTIAASYADTLEGLNGTIAHLDVIHSFAHVACYAPIAYIKPKVVNKGQGDLLLRESRHPCLETLPDINFIPNDADMQRDSSDFQIITGANTGGKSVYLRQIGCIALMAQIGSFVPASEATIPIFDCILARVGAGDSQLKGISTFMAEMLETATILKSATKDSLIIIDELGRGTSTYDGFGLAWAISEHIATEIKCFTLFATHFHDLTTLAEQIPIVKNLHVRAHVEEKSDSITGRDIVMLYKVEQGISDQSFGIHVAELAKFPEEVVRLAKRKADELDEEIAESSKDEASATKLAKFTPEEVAEGTSLVADMLKAWQEKADSELAEFSHNQSKDKDKEDEVRAQKELDLLRESFEEYKEKLEKSAWAAGVLLDTY